MVADICLGGGIKVNIAMYATHAPHILVLEIRGIAKAEHLHSYVVVALAHNFAQVELGIVVGTLRIAHILAVNPHIGCTVNAIEVQHHTLVGPTLGQRKLAAV